MSQILNNRYLVVSKLGQGGMGAVYKAQDSQLGNRLVAVKEMLPVEGEMQSVGEAAVIFKQEADLLAALHHPNLPSVYEHFEQNGRWYLVMSFIDGQNLSQYLSQQGNRLQAEEVLDIGMQLCSVLDYLHTCQPPIIFRDLKPLNVMRSSKGHLYLIDFGIARHFKIGKARDTVLAYSPGYAAPEQFGQAQTTACSDIYSLGATLHHLISGNHPAITPFRFAPIPTSGQSSLERLNRLLLSMVEMDDTRRPASIALVKQELQQVASLYITDQSQTQPANASSASSYQGSSSQPSLAHARVQQPPRPSSRQPHTDRNGARKGQPVAKVAEPSQDVRTPLPPQSPQSHMMYSPRNTSAYGRKGFFGSRYQFQAASGYNVRQASSLVSKVMGLLSLSFLFATIGAFVGSVTLSAFGGGIWILFIAGIIVLFALRAIIQKPGINLFLLYLFTFIGGMAVGPLLGLYFGLGLGYIVTEAFLITAITSITLALYAWVAKTDFSHMRDFLFVGLILIIVASLVNIFFQSTLIGLVICIAGIGIFCGFTLHHIQKAKYLANTLPNAIGITVSLFLRRI